jgi:hypothetical protein
MASSGRAYARRRSSSFITDVRISHLILIGPQHHQWQTEDVILLFVHAPVQAVRAGRVV